MASSVISRDELLEEAYRIADAQGLSALSIHSLAQACHVSVGTIYNHFASKDKLTTATIELFFRRSVFDGFCRLDVHKGFVDYARTSMRRSSVCSTALGAAGLKAPRCSPSPRKMRPICVSSRSWPMRCAAWWKSTKTTPPSVRTYLWALTPSGCAVLPLTTCSMRCMRGRAAAPSFLAFFEGRSISRET